MIDVDWVVGGLVQLMEQSNLAMRKCSRREHSHAELFLTDGLRTAEGEEQTSRRHLLHCSSVQFGVALYCMSHSIAMLGKRRRIEDYQIIGFRHRIQEFEGVFGKGLMASIIREVELDVRVHQVDSLLTAVDGMNQSGSSTHSIDAETACVAEHVQHPTAFGILFDESPIIALVDEESRLLASEPVDVEP